MKLVSLQIEDFRQFKNFRLDFTDPKTGQPLEKVCFIGPNGTGKSTLLRVIAQQSWADTKEPPEIPGGSPELVTQQLLKGTPVCLWSAAENLTELPVIWCPADADRVQALPAWHPQALLRTAIDASDVTTKHTVSLNEAESFWTRIVSHIKRREQLELEFNKLPENQHRTLSEIRAEFEALHPPILSELSKVWDPILQLADLEFDQENAEIPVQLSDQFRAYIRTRSRKTPVAYYALSTGIRHYLFRLGHIWSLYFNRPPGDSLLLVDEPEGSLYPDFLYDIVENYRDVAPGCQLFMATHSPIVASQFKPEERFILTFGDDGYVTARRGISPEGDDPNDMLYKDFGVRNLMPAAGQAKWEQFLELRRRILQTPPENRLPLVEESARIGREYNFPLNGT
jgi:energy-coupling factor transporter ATP-binding protein EcfA2